jgi:hypothetical protein
MGNNKLMCHAQIRTESWWGTFEDSNIWQSVIFAPRDEWFEVMVIGDFLRVENTDASLHL